jgi:hypothetical protein
MKKGYKQTEEHKSKRLEAQKQFFQQHPDCRKGENHQKIEFRLNNIKVTAMS